MARGVQASPAVMDQLFEAVRARNAAREAARKAGAELWTAPKTDDELWNYVKNTWGYEIPRFPHPECYHKGHVAPFKAFADAYFARVPTIMVVGSRGLSGKTMLSALLSITEQATLGADINLLGGSLEQAHQNHKYTVDFWYKPNAPRVLLLGDPTARETRLTNGGHEQVRAASPTSVRGGHPQRLRPDEIDEMDIEILDQALGMPMDDSVRGIMSQVFMTSTHHKAMGPVTEIKRRITRGEMEGEIYTWCYRESMKRTLSDEECLEHNVPKGTETGWLTQRGIDTARGRVNKRMWEVEYELGEPSIEGRAIDTEAVERMFDREYGVFEGDLHEYIEMPCCSKYVDTPCNNHVYVTGADWAMDRDYSIITTWRTDMADGRWWLVAFEKAGRTSWPIVIEKFNRRIRRFPGEGVHDGTSMGGRMAEDFINTVNDAEAVALTGAKRKAIFSDYVVGIENDKLLCPMIKYMYDEHRYVTVEDLFVVGKQGHAPDSVVSGALAWTRGVGLDWLQHAWGGPMSGDLLVGLR